MLFRALPPAAAVALAAVLVAVAPGSAADGHRNGFAGKTPFFVRGDANIQAEEKAHAIDDRHARNAGTSEYIKIEANPAPGTDAEFVHYYYETPPAPITADTRARLWVKGYRGGVQLKARVVLPKERDHDRAFYALCLYMEPGYHQLEFDLRLCLMHAEATGQALWPAPAAPASTGPALTSPP